LANMGIKGSLAGTALRKSYSQFAKTKVQETWDAVQRYLGDGKEVPKAAYRKPECIMPLKGLIFCGHCGGPMNLAVTRRKNRVYGYYRCSRAEKRVHPKCPVRHIGSIELERAVFSQISAILRSPMMLARLKDLCQAEVPQIVDAVGPDFWDEATLEERRCIAEFMIEKVMLYSDRIELEIKAEGISAFKEQIEHESD